jgi:hypothetical protein
METKKKSKLQRISEEFNKELDKIQEAIYQINGDKISKRTLTNMVIKHDAWLELKEDLIKFFSNPKK